MSQIDFTLLNKVRELGRIEKDFVRVYSEVGLTADIDKFKAQLLGWGRGIGLLEEIQGELSSRSSFIVQDREASAVLGRIRSGRPFQSIKFVEAFLSIMGVEQDDWQLDHDEGLQEVSMHYDFGQYRLRKRQVGALLATRDLHDEVKEYFFEAREAFAFGLDRACVSLCRALLERSLRDRRRNGQGDLSQMIDSVLSGRTDYVARQKAHRVRKAANSILHLVPNAGGERMPVESILLDTMDVVEYLHGRRQ